MSKFRFLVGVLVTSALGCGVQGGGPGTTGTAGQTGSAGSTGSAGATSSAGTTGGAGTTGSGGGDTGAAGSSATAGTIGTAGSSGSAGATATAGTTGSAGTTGTAGSTGAGGALSGVTIKIGNVDVPKENAIAFIHFGHSNMAGRALNPVSSRPYFFDAAMTDPHAWTYHAASLAPYVNGAKAGFELAIEPKTAGDSKNNRTGTMAGGFGTALLKEAVSKGQSGKYFISLGFGIASAYCSQFKPGALYYNSLITAAKELKGKVTFGAIVVMLGITERHGTTADITGFPECIRDIAAAVRNDVGEPNLPLLINGYEMGASDQLAPTQPFPMQIIPQIARIPNVVPTSAVVPLDNPLVQIEMNEMFEPNGDHHFTFDGHKEFARRVVQTMKDKGWWRW
jgi:hypothetical protein